MELGAASAADLAQPKVVRRPPPASAKPTRKPIRKSTKRSTVKPMRSSKEKRMKKLPPLLISKKTSEGTRDLSALLTPSVISSLSMDQVLKIEDLNQAKDILLEIIRERDSGNITMDPLSISDAKMKRLDEMIEITDCVGLVTSNLERGVTSTKRIHRKKERILRTIMSEKSETAMKTSKEWESLVKDNVDHMQECGYFLKTLRSKVSDFMMLEEEDSLKDDSVMTMMKKKSRRMGMMNSDDEDEEEPYDRRRLIPLKSESAQSIPLTAADAEFLDRICRRSEDQIRQCNRELRKIKQRRSSSKASMTSRGSAVSSSSSSASSSSLSSDSDAIRPSPMTTALQSDQMKVSQHCIDVINSVLSNVKEGNQVHTVQQLMEQLKDVLNELRFGKMTKLKSDPQYSPLKMDRQSSDDSFVADVRSKLMRSAPVYQSKALPTVPPECTNSEFRKAILHSVREQHSTEDRTAVVSTRRMSPAMDGGRQAKMKERYRKRGKRLSSSLQSKQTRRGITVARRVRIRGSEEEKMLIHGDNGDDYHQKLVLEYSQSEDESPDKRAASDPAVGHTVRGIKYRPRSRSVSPRIAATTAVGHGVSAAAVGGVAGGMGGHLTVDHAIPPPPPGPPPLFALRKREMIESMMEAAHRQIDDHARDHSSSMMALPRGSIISMRASETKLPLPMTGGGHRYRPSCDVPEDWEIFSIMSITEMEEREIKEMRIVDEMSVHSDEKMSEEKRMMTVDDGCEDDPARKDGSDVWISDKKPSLLRKSRQKMVDGFLSDDLSVAAEECDIRDICDFLLPMCVRMTQLSEESEQRRRVMSALNKRLRITKEERDLSQSLECMIRSYAEVPSLIALFDPGLMKAKKITDYLRCEKLETLLSSEDGSHETGTRIDVCGLELSDPVQTGCPVMGTIVIRNVFRSNTKPIAVDCLSESGLRTSTAIFKSGDDLRRDAAVLSVLRLMNRLWEQSSRELSIGDCTVFAHTYRCIPMGDSFGAIQLVSDCMNIGDISKSMTLSRHSRHRLVASAVGSYMACFILGSRDRHFDNILIRRSDMTCFHVDFNYILGRSLSGLDASEMAITERLKGLCAKDWPEFVRLGTAAFMVIRAHHSIVIRFAQLAFAHLFTEYQVEHFIRAKLLLSQADEDAAKHIALLISKAPSNRRTRFKNTLHKFHAVTKLKGL